MADADRPGSDVLKEGSGEDARATELAVAQFIQGRINFERLPTERYGLSDFKLERMRTLLSRLGNPQQQPAVHLAGTKGKGSTAAMIAAMLRASGSRVGLFTSPHVSHFGERMTVNGAPPTSREFLGLLDELRPVVEAMDREDDALRPTFFEVLTAMAWLHFRNREVNMVVLETGLGGRLDATNVCDPLVCLITSISRDHERLLGSTLAEIGREKAGIIKPHVPVISGVTNEEPQRVIRSVAEEVGAPLLELDRDIHFQPMDTTGADQQLDAEPRFTTLDIQTPWRSHKALTSPLAGVHQAANLSLAVAAVDALQESGRAVSPAHIVAGLRQLEWPLRVEVIRHRPLVIVDAAHNVASVAALVDALQPVRASERVLVFGSARDKDSAGMLAQLAGAFDHVILTRFVNNPRALSRSQLEELARTQLRRPWVWADDPDTAWKLARQMTSPSGLICATGSFFLAAEFRSVARPSPDDC